MSSVTVGAPLSLQQNFFLQAIQYSPYVKAAQRQANRLSVAVKRAFLKVRGSLDAMKPHFEEAATSIKKKMKFITGMATGMGFATFQLFGADGHFRKNTKALAAYKNRRNRELTMNKLCVG